MLFQMAPLSRAFSNQCVFIWQCIPQWRTKIVNWEGGTNSRMQVLIRSKHWISKEINAAEHKYKNMLSPQLTILIRHWYPFSSILMWTEGQNALKKYSF